MYFVLLAFAVVCVVRNFRLPKIKGDIIPIQIMMYGLLIITAIYIFSIILHGGLRYFNLDLMKVYDFRDLAAENLPGISEYLSPVVEKVLLPFILLFSVYRRKWFIACLALAGSVMMLGLTGNKGALFYPIFVLGIYWIMNSHQAGANTIAACSLYSGYSCVINFFFD